MLRVHVCGLIVMTMIGLLAAAWPGAKAKKEKVETPPPPPKNTNVIQLKKMTKMNLISVHKFHSLNKGHLIYNYFSVKSKEKKHMANFHNLQYAGEISIGDPAQKLTVIYETATADVMVLSPVYCTTLTKVVKSFCWSHKYYDSRKSKTAGKEGELSPTFNLEYPGGSELNGNLLYDTITLAAGVSVAQAKIGLIDQWKNTFFYANVDGIAGIGLRPSSKFSDHTYINNVSEEDGKKIAARPTLIEQLKSEGESKKIGLHLYLDKHGHEIGQLILQAEDETERYQGNLEWHSAPQPKNTFWSAFWRLDVHKMQIMRMGDGSIDQIEIKHYYAVPDPGTSLIAGPERLIEEIHKHIFMGFKKNPKREDKYGTIQFDCAYREQLPIVVFNINHIGYLLEPKDYVKKIQGTCTTGFMGVQRLGLLMLGDTFLRKYYMVFDLEQERIGLAQSVPPK